MEAVIQCYHILHRLKLLDILPQKCGNLCWVSNASRRYCVRCVGNGLEWKWSVCWCVNYVFKPACAAAAATAVAAADATADADNLLHSRNLCNSYSIIIRKCLSKSFFQRSQTYSTQLKLPTQELKRFSEFERRTGVGQTLVVRIWPHHNIQQRRWVLVSTSTFE